MGLLDLFEMGKEYGEQAAAALERMTAAIADYGAAMTRRAEQMNEINSGGKPDMSSAKKLAALAAEDTLVFVRRIEGELPIFADSWRRTLECSTRAANLSVSDFRPTDNASRDAKLKELGNLLASMKSAEKAMDEMEGGTATFRDSLQRFPRLSVQLNKAKKQAVDVLNRLLEQRNVARQLNVDAMELIGDLVQRVKSGG